MRWIKKVYRDYMKLFDAGRLTFHIKEWYEFYHFNTGGHIIIGLLFPVVVLLYPILRLTHQRCVAEVRANGDIYELKSESGVFFHIPKMETDIMHGYYLLAEDYHDHNILPGICSRYIKPDSVICDIGANIGNHTVYFAKHCVPRIIYAFEPVKETFEYLMDNVRLNHFEDTVNAMNVALGAKAFRGDVKVTDESNCGANQIHEDGNGEVTGITLDSLGIGKVDFFKIDVEGFEYNVIMGGYETLRKSDATIFIEIFDDRFERVNSLLEEIGYHVVPDDLLRNRHDYIYKKRT